MVPFYFYERQNMSLITTLPDNKIGPADDIQAVNTISNILSNNGSKQYTVYGSRSFGTNTTYFYINPYITVNGITSVQSNVIINVNSYNTVLYYVTPQPYQYNSLNRCYSIKVSLNVTYPTTISFYGTQFIDMGGINQTTFPIGKYYLIFKYYLEDNVCFYRILK